MYFYKFSSVFNEKNQNSKWYHEKIKIIRVLLKITLFCRNFSYGVDGPLYISILVEFYQWQIVPAQDPTTGSVLTNDDKGKFSG